MKKSIVASAIAVGVLGAGGVALAHTLQYRAEPVGAFEVPAKTTAGEGSLKLKLNPERTELRYDLKITEPLTDILQAHLHRNVAGANGPIVVWLYPSAPPLQLIPGEFEGRLEKGVITADDLCFSATAPLCGQWDTFLDLLGNEGLYVNVHTVVNPGGEIRDQVHLHD
jgi:hypothetical protein